MLLNYFFCIMNMSMCNMCKTESVFLHVHCAAFVVGFAAELRCVADPILHHVHGSSCHLACTRRFKHKPNQNVSAFQNMLVRSTETCSRLKHSTTNSRSRLP